MTDDQAGRNEPWTVLLVKGSLFTIFGMCLSIGAEVPDSFRELASSALRTRFVEDGDRG